MTNTNETTNTDSGSILTSEHDQIRAELIDQTNKMIINDYINYMKEYEEWSSEDVERFLAEDPFAEIPESFAQSYYAQLDFYK